MQKITIYHNPNCSTSRNALALIYHLGIEPCVINYLETPFTEAKLREILTLSGASVRDILRTNEPLYDELNLSRELSEDELLKIALENQILINRPIVVSDRGARLCRPLERLLEVSPAPLLRPFVKENGEEILP